MIREEAQACPGFSSGTWDCLGFFSLQFIKDFEIKIFLRNRPDTFGSKTAQKTFLFATDNGIARGCWYKCTDKSER